VTELIPFLFEKDKVIRKYATKKEIAHWRFYPIRETARQAMNISRSFRIAAVLKSGWVILLPFNSYLAGFG